MNTTTSDADVSQGDTDDRDVRLRDPLTRSQDEPSVALMQEVEALLLREGFWSPEAAEKRTEDQKTERSGESSRPRRSLLELDEPDKLAGDDLPAGILDVPSSDCHPVIHSVRRFLVRKRKECRRHAWQELAKILAAIAERYGASRAEIFLLPYGWESDVDSNPRLRCVATHNIRPPQTRVNDVLGIISHVARSGRKKGGAARPIGYYTNRTDLDPFYREDDKTTRAEIAVPIVEPKGGALLGVVNLEAMPDNKLPFNPDHFEEIRAAIGAAVPHLLVLQVLDPKAPADLWIPWHPDVCGWDLTAFLQRLCHIVASQFEPHHAKASIWYHDDPKKTFFVYATSGYDIEYMHKHELPVEGTLMGRTVKSSEGTVISEPSTELYRWRKAQRMGLSWVLSCPIRCPHSEAPREPYAERGRYGISALAVYFQDPEHAKGAAAADAMRALAAMIGRLCVNFSAVRIRYAVAHMHWELYQKPKSSEADFAIVRDHLKTIFSADGVTIWPLLQRPKLSDDAPPLPNGLYVPRNGTTGLRRNWSKDRHPLPPEARSALEPYLAMIEGCPARLDVNDEKHGGYTVYLARNGKPTTLRINDFLDRREQEISLPADLPPPSLAYVETFEPDEDARRRMLACNVVQKMHRSRDGNDEETDTVLGVIRVLRRPETKPFTRCDEDLIATLGDFCWKQFVDWEAKVRAVEGTIQRNRQVAAVPVIRPRRRMSERDKARMERREAAERLRRPISFGMRSTGRLIEELVRDLCHSFPRHGQTRVAARLMEFHTGFPNEWKRTGRLRTHAAWSLPDVEPEDPDPACLYENLLIDRQRAVHPQPEDDRLVVKWFEQRNIESFELPREGKSKLVSGLWLPVRTWSVGGLLEGILAIETDGDTRRSDKEAARRLLFEAACRLCAIWGVTDKGGLGPSIVRPEILSVEWGTAWKRYVESLGQRAEVELTETILSPDEVEGGDGWKQAGETLMHHAFEGTPPIPDEAALDRELKKARDDGRKGQTSARDEVCHLLNIRRVVYEAVAFGVRVSSDRESSHLAIPLWLGQICYGYLKFPNIYRCNTNVRISTRSLQFDRLSALLADVSGNWSNLAFAQLDQMMHSNRRHDTDTLKPFDPQTAAAEVFKTRDEPERASAPTTYRTTSDSSDEILVPASTAGIVES